MAKSGIYKIENTVDGNMYIGSAVDFAARKRVHLHQLRKDKHHSPYLQRAFNKHGEQSFVFSLIEETQKDRNILFNRETYWIQTLKPKYNGAAVTASRLGMPIHEVTKIKLREYNLRPEVIAKKKAELTGHEVKPETIELIKAARAKQEVTESMLKGLEVGRAMTPAQRKGMTGKKHSEATIAMMQEKARNRPPVSEETRHRQSEAAKKRHEKR